MKWMRYHKPEKKGQYLLALKNTARDERFYGHIEITDTGEWIRPYSEGELIYYGPHIEIEASARITSPFKP